MPKKTPVQCHPEQVLKDSFSAADDFFVFILCCIFFNQFV